MTPTTTVLTPDLLAAFDESTGTYRTALTLPPVAMRSRSATRDL